jgi:hypothetical protein
MSISIEHIHAITTIVIHAINGVIADIISDDSGLTLISKDLTYKLDFRNTDSTYWDYSVNWYECNNSCYPTCYPIYTIKQYTK